MPSVIDIIPYSEALKSDIKRLNYEWLEHFFHLEESDIRSLSDPQRYIIDAGGFIFFARKDCEIVGTVSLLKHSEHTFELGKMAVSAQARGLGIGHFLMQYCIIFAEQQHIQTLILYSNTTLQAAIHLYQKYGFYEIPLEKGLYERANIKMEKQLRVAVE